MRNGNHSPEHMARMYDASSGSRVRIFTAPEQQFIRDAYPEWRTWSLEAMAAELQCRVDVLKREAKRLGLPPRREQSPPVKASQLRTKRVYNQRADPDGERSNPDSEARASCPHCGCRALTEAGHPLGTSGKPRCLEAA